jgi:hypothetical protein
VVFGIGYGTGVSWHATKNNSSTSLSIKQNNYTTKPTTLPPQARTAEGEHIDSQVGIPEVKGDQTTDASSKVAPASADIPKAPVSKQVSDNCPIKGNVSKDSKIYHVPGGSFYNRVKPERCFQTEGEAKAAGFRKSTR